MPLEDRPVEKLFLRGQQSLTDTELLEVLIHSGSRGSSVTVIASGLIEKFRNLAVLCAQNPEAIRKHPGLGPSKAARLLAAFEISRRVLSQSKWLFDKKITSPSMIAEYFIPILRDESKERFLVISLNFSNQVIKYDVISIGTLNSSLVHPREVFKVAIENNAASVILMHNHPSGNLEPSKEDLSITARMIEAGKILDIQVFDHIIVAGSNYMSFVERKII